MNKRITIITALFVALIGLSFTATAGSHQSYPLISGTNTFLATATTNSVGASNTWERAGTTYTNALDLAIAPLWDNPDGSVANASAFFVLVGTNANFTNIINIDLIAVPRHREGSSTAVTAAAGIQTFSITGNGTTPVVLTTNLIGATFQGSSGIKAQFRYPTQLAGTNTSTAFFREAHINGFRP